MLPMATRYLRVSLFYIFFTAHLIVIAQDITRPGNAFGDNHTPTWEACLASYESMDAASDFASLSIAGQTDVGKPIHLFIINKDKIFYPELLDPGKTVLLINNAIHPGEPDGVDACLQLCAELLDPANPMHKMLDKVIVCIVPVFNVDGALMRNGTLRANQNGPEAYGFRGNARNLDLNRDFVKCDSENARSFCRLFRSIRPHVLIDTHVTNGADYTYTMTLISTQSDKLGGPVGEYQRNVFTPALFDAMALRGDTMSPYVNTMGRSPETGLYAFLESPRFLSGYAALFSTFAFITETHMLKPYPQRVASTHRFLTSMLEFLSVHGEEVREAKRKSELKLQATKDLPLGWSLDTTQVSPLQFSGYAVVEEPALVGTGNRIRYDHNAPFTRAVNYYDRYAGTGYVKIPEAYIVPQAWREVVERLKCNRVLMKPITHDTVMTVGVSYIVAYETADSPYEGHYPHDHIEIRNDTMKVQLFKGDWLIDTHQEARRYLVEVLEPQGEDSFFAWNFFDAVLQRKEWFSDYVFEEKAAAILDADPKLKSEFDSALQQDEGLRASHWRQLFWIYERSDYSEASAFRYPVYRLVD
jgi:Zinc carboxypeptidase